MLVLLTSVFLIKYENAILVATFLLTYLNTSTIIKELSSFFHDA